jgi:hypothetical protein
MANINYEKINYKFIFPTYNNIKTTSVKTLIDNNKEFVKTYEQLGSVEKSYIDEYISIPKYFDLRVFADDTKGTDDISAQQREIYGFSLIVSHSPEVLYKTTHAWTKFHKNNKVIYCSIIVSSGDFYYNFNLPDEVLEKSKLRDHIVASHFHSNWYATASECKNYQKYFATINPQRDTGAEKDVFIVKNFKPSLTYSIRLEKTGDTLKPWVPTSYDTIKQDLKKVFIDLEVTRRILCNGNSGANYISSISGIPQVLSGTGTNTVLSFSPPQEYLNHPPMPIKYWQLRDALNNRDPYGDCETVLVMWVADSDPSNIADGNVTALHNLNWKQYAVPISVRCCKADTGSSNAYNTKRFLISYPLDKQSDNNYLYRFHTRCNDIYNKNIFKEALYLQQLIEYSRDYAVVYYNRGYINTASLKTNYFNIHKALFSNNNTKGLFKELYIRKECSSMTNNAQKQNYYIKLTKNNEYRIAASTDNTTYILSANNNDQSDVLNPNSSHVYNSNAITVSDYLKNKYANWYFNSSTDWKLDGTFFITLFGLGNNAIKTITGTIELVNAAALYKGLRETWSYSYTWDDIYLSSFGIATKINWGNADHLLKGQTDPQPVIPFEFLDGIIKIGGTVYGSKINNKVIIGFKDVYDYKYSTKDYNHFRYNAASGSYKLVNNTAQLFTAYYIDV